MRTLTRYVTIELIKIFLVTLMVLTLLVVVVVIVREAINKGLGPIPVLRLIPYVLPNALRFAVPGTLLFSACTVYGRMSASNELVATKSLGISPMVVLWPVFILAFFTSLAAVWLNDLAVSWGRQGIRHVVIESIEDIIYGVLLTQRTYSTDHFSIHVQDVDGRTLIQPMITLAANEDAPAITMIAETAEIRGRPEQNELVIYLTDSSVEVGSEISAVVPGTIERVIPLSDPSHKNTLSSGPSHLPLRDIPQTIKQQRSMIQEQKRLMASEATYQLLLGDFTALTDEQWTWHKGQLKSQINRLQRLQLEPYRRWANGFSCLCFVAIGAPLAIRMRNSDLMTTFGTCFIPILVFYYPFLIVAVDRAKSGTLPPYCVWIGNVILLALSVWFLRRVIRY